MRNVILDCDTGEDDALAILYALAKSIPLQYIVTSYGNTSIDNSTKNSANLLYLAKNKNVKVIKGLSKPSCIHPIEKSVTAGDFVGKNGICNTRLAPSRYNNIIDVGEEKFCKYLVDLLIRIGPVDYIITGPCTNFSSLIEYAGTDLKKYIKNLYIMGGALYTAGNSGPVDFVTNNQVAEFNFYCDAIAASKVINSGLPIRLITWDITQKATISYKEIMALKPTSPISRFVLHLMKNFFMYYGIDHSRDFEFNDPLTIAAYLGKGSFLNKRIQIKETSIDYGKTYVSNEGARIQYFYLDDPKPLLSDILSRLGFNR